MKIFYQFFLQNHFSTLAFNEASVPNDIWEEYYGEPTEKYTCITNNSKPTISQSFFYFHQISKILKTISSVVKIIISNCYIPYAHSLILHAHQEMVAASTSQAAVQLSKTEFAPLNATQMAMENIHGQMFKQMKKKIL